MKDFEDMVRRFEGACQTSVRSLWCGCGSPEDAYMWIRDALEAHHYITDDDDWRARHERKKAFWAAYPPGVQHILAGVLDELGLVEHGSSWMGAWLTADGKAARDILSGMTDKEIEAAYDAVSNRATGCLCYPGPCPHCGAKGGV